MVGIDQLLVSTEKTSILWMQTLILWIKVLCVIFVTYKIGMYFLNYLMPSETYERIFPPKPTNNEVNDEVNEKFWKTQAKTIVEEERKRRNARNAEKDSTMDNVDS